MNFLAILFMLQLAVVNGQPVTEQDVRAAAAAELEAAERKRLVAEATFARENHSALERALDRIVQERVIALETAKRGVTETQLFQVEIEDKVQQVTDPEIAAFYESNRARIPATLEQAGEQIRLFLMNQRKGALYDGLIARLKKDYGYESRLQPFRSDIATEGHPARGPANAPVTLVEFSDFECPFCGSLFPTLLRLERNYGDKIRIVFRQFPIAELHPNAPKAAEASLCANEQQRFWDLHDAMFSDQQKLSVPDLKARASELKFDVNRFNTCLDSGKYADAVKKDISEGSKAGVSGTPGIFINGRFLSGARPYEELQQIIDEELQLSQAAR
jgi:predicted DsbA family dithiol-disulfide isomerase